MERRVTASPPQRLSNSPAEQNDSQSTFAPGRHGERSRYPITPASGLTSMATRDDTAVSLSTKDANEGMQSMTRDRGTGGAASRNRGDFLEEVLVSEVIVPGLVDKAPKAVEGMEYGDSTPSMMEGDMLPDKLRTDMDTGSDSSGGISGWFKTLKLTYLYTVTDVRRRPRNTLIGVAAVFLLVFFTGVVLLGIWKAPYIFLRLIELSTSEADIVLYGANSAPVVNYTALNSRLLSGQEVRGAAPRWVLRASMSAGVPSALSGLLGGGASCTHSTAVSTGANILVVDSEKEKAIGLGRGWKLPILRYNQTQVYYSAADYIDVSPEGNDQVNFLLDYNALSAFAGLPIMDRFIVERPDAVTDPVSLFWWIFFESNHITEDSVNVLEYVNLRLGATLESTIKDIEGKYPYAFGNVALLDSRYVIKMLVEQSRFLQFPMPPVPPLSGDDSDSSNSAPQTLGELLGITPESVETFNLGEFAMMVAAVLNDRYKMYYADTAERSRYMVRKSNAMMVAAGIDFPGNVEYPLISAMNTMDMFKILMVSSFITVVVCIAVLGAILMLALLRINADERQCELAIIRSQGMPRKRLVLIFLAQTLTFTVPGTVLSVVCVFAINAAMEAIMANFTLAPAKLTELPVAVGIICAVLGMVIPLIATWGPISRALGVNLRDALNVIQQSTTAAYVEALRLEDIGLSMWQILLGFFLVVAGFMVYYLMPYAFVYQNMMLFFVLLDIILVCMVVGLCMILYVAESWVERAVLYMLLWGSERRLHTLIERNLHSHRERNSKAYMMFLLSVGCLVAAGAMFSMLSNISSSLAELTNGAHIIVTSSSFKVPLDTVAIDSFLSTQGSEYVLNWAYSSFPLHNYPQVSGNTYIANFVGGYRSIGVTAVSDRFVDAVYSDYVMIDTFNFNYRNGYDRKDVVRSMYNSPPSPAFSAEHYSEPHRICTGLPEGRTGEALAAANITWRQQFTVPFLVASAVKTEVGIDIHSFARLMYTYTVEGVGSVQSSVYMEPRALMKRVSGFVAMSSLPVLFRSGTILVPETDFAKLLNPVEMDFPNNSRSNYTLRSNAVTEIRNRTLYVRLRHGVGKKQRESFANALQSYIDRVYHTTVDTQVLVENMRSVQNMIMYLFYFTAAVCIVLCAFMMWVTFISNVHLNAWTFGVLRSIGFRMPQLIRSAIYEALCIVISAFVLGVAIGVVVGVTLTLQFSRILVLPFQFDMPYILIFIIFGLALAAAVLGSTIPCLSMQSHSISSVLKGL